MTPTKLGLRLQKVEAGGNPITPVHIEALEVEAVLAGLKREMIAFARAIDVEILSIAADQRAGRLFLRVQTDLGCDNPANDFVTFDAPARRVH